MKEALKQLIYKATKLVQVSHNNKKSSNHTHQEISKEAKVVKGMK